jgi:hypothetical protein
MRDTSAGSEASTTPISFSAEEETGTTAESGTTTATVDDATPGASDSGLFETIEQTELHQILVELGAGRINYLQWPSDGAAGGPAFWGWQAGEFVEGELSSSRTMLFNELERQGIDLQSDLPEAFSWQGEDLIISTRSKTLGLYWPGGDPIIEETLDFVPVGNSSTLTVPHDSFVGGVDEVGLSRFITFAADGTHSEHVFYVEPEPDHQGVTLASLLGVVADRYGVYQKFDSRESQGVVSPETFDYDIYDLVDQRLAYEFGPLASGLELGLVG